MPKSTPEWMFMRARRSGHPERRRPRRLGLDALEPRRLLATFVVTSIEDSLQVNSLRWAISQANANVNSPGQPDVIAFDIPGGGAHTIRVNSPLPPILDSVVIDGTSQPGYNGSSPAIEISGANLLRPGSSNGLQLYSPSIVRALTINDFPGYGIRVHVGGNVVESSFIGTTRDGTSSAGNGLGGILIDGGGGNLIGSSGAGSGNLISGNQGAGIRISSTSVGANLIHGNRIGVDRSGVRALPNRGDGILVEGGAENQIGGTTPAHRNVISGNSRNGIRVTGNASQTMIAQNLIGTDRAGHLTLGNGLSGIRLEGSNDNQIGMPGAGNVIAGNVAHGVWIVGGNGNALEANRIGGDGFGATQPGIGNGGSGLVLEGARGTRVGGTATNAGNVIGGNGKHGVLVVGDTSLHNTIRGNSIFANSGLGIDLGDDGVTPNDPLDADIGPNRLQNVPVLTRAETAMLAGMEQTLLAGSMHSRPDAILTLDFYSNGLDSTAQGRATLGATTVQTDAEGNADFRISLPVRTLLGHTVTATATDSDGNTSEFSVPVVVAPADAADVVLTVEPPHDPVILPLGLDYVLTVRNDGTANARNVQVIDVLDDPMAGRFVAAEILHGAMGAIERSNQRVAVNLGTLVPGEWIQIRFVVEPTRTGTITSTAEALLDNLDYRPDNNVAIMQATVIDEADLSVRFADDSPIVAVAGQELYYPIEILNRGPGAATGVNFTAGLSAGATFLGISTESADLDHSYDEPTRTLTIFVGDLPANTSLVLRIKVRPDDVESTWLDVRVEGNENIRRNAPGDNDAARKVVDVTPAADLGVSLHEPPHAALTGQTFTYLIDVASNPGPSAASNVVLTANLPAGTTYLSSSIAPASMEGASLSFALGTMNPNFPAMRVAIEVVVGEGATGPLTFHAAIRSDTLDLNPRNDVATASTFLNPADVSLILASPADVDLGVPFRYEATVHNLGPAAAGSMLFLLNLPLGLEFQPSQSTPGLRYDPDTRRLNLDLANLAPDTSTNVEISVLANTTRFLAASAGIAIFGQRDPSLDNNIRVVTTHVNSTDLSVEFESEPTDSAVDVPLRLVVQARNNGPRTATNSTITIPVPPGAAFDSAQAIAGVVGIDQIGGTIVARLDPLSVGGSASFVITLRPRYEGTLNITATVRSDQLDDHPANDTARLSLDVRNAPGRMQFRQSAYPAVEGEALVVTVDRVGGTKGAVATFYQVIGGTARPGIDYQPSGGVLIFLDGETSKTFRVPLPRDGEVTGDRTIELTLSDIGFGSLGSRSNSVILVREVDVDVTPPVVNDVQLMSGPAGITAATVFFSEPLEPSRAIAPRNYVLLTASGVAVPTSQAIYDASSHSVRVVPARPLPAGGGTYLIVNGDGPSAITDLSANALDGDRDRVAGGQFVAFIARGSSLSYADDNGDLVDLRLTGGGWIEQARSLNGTVLSTRVVGAVTGRSVLSGTVRLTSPNGDGITNLGTLSGIGSFGGGAESKLTSPPFFAANGPLPSAANAVRFGRNAVGRMLRSR